MAKEKSNKEKMIEWATAQLSIFATAPSEPIKMTACETVVNPCLFVQTQLNIMQAYDDDKNRIFVCAYLRLLKLKRYLDHKI